MKRIMIVILFCFAANYVSSQTLVKLALPNNCNAVPTNVENLIPDKDSRLEIFPNPNSGIFTLSVSFNDNINKAVITVYDAKGKSVFTETVYSNSNKLIKHININGLVTGTYIFEVKNNKQASTAKLLMNK